MVVAIHIRGSETEFPEIHVVVHCEGQELEIMAGTWLQLRQSLNDIARLESGPHDFRILGE
jgi:hypothetical protein